MNRFLSASLLVVLVLMVGAAAQAGDKLFLWQVDGENATVYLTGSIHVGKPDFFPLADPIEDAFAKSQVLAVEVDVTSPEVIQASAQIVMARGMLEGETTLQDRLEPATWERLSAYAEEKNVPLAMFQKMKPGIVAIVLTMNEYQNAGYDPELGIDKFFLLGAAKDGQEVRQLEKVEDQLELFLEVTDQLDDPLMMDMLDQIGDLVGFTEKMIALWRAGDAEGLDRFMQDQMGEDPQLEVFYRKLLDDRNVKMVTTIDEWLHGDENVFVVVGAGHYGGEMGILKLLEGKGWKVTQIEQ